MERLKYLFTFFLIGFLSFNLLAQDDKINCQKIKKGRFEMVGPQGGSIRIKRKSKVQVERYSRQRVKHRFYIKWIDDCNYELTLKKSKIKSLINDTEIKLYVSVIDIDKYYYTALIKSNKNGNQERIEIQIK